MSILFAILVIFMISIALVTYHHKTEKRKKEFYPRQKALLLELIGDIERSAIDIILSQEGPGNSSVTLTLFEISAYIDNNKELSHERYEDLKLFFTDTSNQVIDFKKYIGNRFLPEEVMTELKHFYNTKYIKAQAEGLYFIVITEMDGDSIAKDNISEGLLSGNGEAFNSWQAFKESAHNLNFVIRQWFREHEGSAELSQPDSASLVDR